jgi:protease IV
MKNFFSTMFASLLGSILAAVILFFIGFLIIIAISSSNSDEENAQIEKHSILNLDFGTKITDKEPSNPIDGFSLLNMRADLSIGIKTVLDNIAKAKADENIDGIFMNLSSLDVELSNVEEIRNALLNFKESKKFIYSFANNYSQKSYFLASVSDKIYLNPVGDLEFIGLGAQVLFYKKVLDKFGIEPVIIRHGKFKSAVEPFMLDKMSEANKEQLLSYVGSIWSQMLKGISKERNIEVSRLNQIADSLLISSANASVSEGLIDSLAYYDQVIEKLQNKTKEKKEGDLKLVSLSKYIKVPKPKNKNEKGLAKDKIAVIYATGEIVMGSGDGTNIGAESLSKIIKEARKDEKTKAIVLRVNSPGGSALASEIIWREMDLARKTKPVIVSMGSLAASGGYYISCAADTIVAEPTTLTGSIGVFGLLFNIEKLLNDKIGITVDRVNTNKYSDLGSAMRKMKPEEQAFIQKSVEDIYATFIKHVADGRGLTVGKVDDIGQGRIWSGINALEIGLVDTLGGLNLAIEIAAKKAKLDKYRLENFPKKKETIDAIMELFGEDSKTKALGSELQDFEPYYKAFINIKKMKGIQARIPFEIILN